jgi:hypothetical protein
LVPLRTHTRDWPCSSSSSVNPAAPMNTAQGSPGEVAVSTILGPGQDDPSLQIFKSQLLNTSHVRVQSFDLWTTLSLAPSLSTQVDSL